MDKLFDIVDEETGEIYKEDVLLACGLMWAVNRGFIMTKTETDIYEGKPVHWIFIKATTQQAIQNYHR
jgi:hypothetical protein